MLRKPYAMTKTHSHFHCLLFESYIYAMQQFNTKWRHSKPSESAALSSKFVSGVKDAKQFTELNLHACCQHHMMLGVVFVLLRHTIRNALCHAQSVRGMRKSIRGARI
jgi:hypothetical protein